MTLAGPLTGSHKITALNNGKGTLNTGKLLLTGNNSNYTGTWDATVYSTKYPDTQGYITLLEGSSENAFGKGKIIVGLDNKVIFSHPNAAGDTQDLTLENNAKAVLKVNG